MTVPVVTSSDGVTVALHELSGPLSGRDLVLVCHATGFSALCYSALGRVLGSRFDVVGLDFRGHGDSTVPSDGDFDWSRMTADVFAVLRALGVSRPVRLVAHSMGASVALLAERERPGTFSAAFLYEPIVPSGEAARTAGRRLAEAARRRRGEFASRPDALARYASRPPLNSLQAGVLSDYVEHALADEADGTVALKCRPENEAATFEATGKPGYEQLAAVRAPAVVAAGEVGDEPGWSPASDAEAVADALFAGRLERFAALGHLGPLEAPVRVGRAALAALLELG